MATNEDNTNESEMEELYRRMTDEDLQNTLRQEKCLDKRRLLRKEIRTRNNSSALTRAMSQNIKAESPLILSARVKRFVEPSSIEHSDAKTDNKQVKNMENTLLATLENSSETQKELDGLLKELRNTLDLDRRRNLRARIKILQSNIGNHPIFPSRDTTLTKELEKSTDNSKSNISKEPLKINQNLTEEDNFNAKKSKITPLSAKVKEYPLSVPKKPEVSDKLKDTNTKKEIMNRVPSSHTKSSNLPISKNSSVVENTDVNNEHLKTNIKLPDHSSTFTTNERQEATKTITKPMDILNYKIKVFENEDVVLRYNQKNLDWQNMNIRWFFKKKAIEDYATTYFHNMLCSKHVKDGIELRFSNAINIKHQGIYKLEVTSKGFSLEVNFELMIEKKITVKVENLKTATTLNEINEIPLNYMIPRHLERSSTAHVSQVKSDIKPVLETSLKEESPLRKSNVSTVSSMREMFEKKDDSNKFENNNDRSIRRRVGIASPLGKNLEEIVQNKLCESLDNKAIKSSQPPEVHQVTLVPPSQATRKISQSGIMKMIPVMKTKAKLARSSVQQTKEVILNFCNSNTQEYENVKITNYSGSWADGLAFCALIHHFYPNAFDYSKLTTADRAYNFNLAFETAKKLAGIEPLLDTEDMVILENPDWKCVYTYVQLMYSILKSHPKNVLKKI